MRNNQITLEEAKKIELNILKYLDDICSKIGIKYYIAYGTLIGAVRHKGFIPWDDDIDVWLFREDYELLLDYVKENRNDIYKLFTSDDDGYYISYAKIVDQRTTMSEYNYPAIQGYGLFIDIFPLDYIPDNIFLKSILFFVFKKLNLAKALSIEIKNLGQTKGVKFFVRTILKFVCQVLGYKFFIKSIELIIYIFLRKKTNQVSVVYSSNEIPIFDVDNFQTGMMLEFENERFNAPINYDKILRLIYGDYMELPPLEKRSCNHNFVDCKYVVKEN